MAKTKKTKEIVLPKIMQDCVIKFSKMLETHREDFGSQRCVKATKAYVKAKAKAARWFKTNEQKLKKLKEENERTVSGYSVAAPCIINNIPSIDPCGPGFRD